jgi:hypothetical protein
MKKNIDYEIHYDLSVEITYLGEENPGEHYFSLHRVFPDGKIEIESYEGGYLRDEEVEAIGKMMEEILANLKSNSND